MYDPLHDIRTTLATYLRDTVLGLPAVMPADKPVTVFDEWPSPQEALPERAVSIVVAEQMTDVRYWSPQVFELTPDAPGAVTGRVRYSHGRFKVAVQLDVWAVYPDARSELVRALNTVLHRHPQVTLPGGDGYARPGHWHELVRLAGDLPGGLLAYRFPDVPSFLDDGGSAQGGEYRALFQGSVYGVLTTEEAAGILRTITLDLTATDASGTASENVTI